jgi:hypothetical protein
LKISRHKNIDKVPKELEKKKSLSFLKEKLLAKIRIIRIVFPS